MNLGRLSEGINRVLILVGGISLMGMMFLACANMFFRAVWVPVKGTFEIMGFLGAIVASFALGYTQMKKGHIAVDILVNRFPKKVQMILDSINYLLNSAFFGLIAWRIALWATTIWKSGEVSETLKMPYHPFIYGVAVGCGFLALVLFIDFLRSLILPFQYVPPGPYRLFLDFLKSLTEEKR